MSIKLIVNLVIKKLHILSYQATTQIKNQGPYFFPFSNGYIIFRQDINSLPVTLIIVINTK
jgi:hypothetical protein